MDALVAEVRACRVCAAHLPLAPRPVLQAGPKARLLTIDQAPGLGVHRTATPWNDPSGERLHAWLALDRTLFYGPTRVAILPMSFCYPGRGASGDLPPRPACAPLWHARLLALMPGVRLTLLVGRYAQQAYLGARAKATVTETVRARRHYLPRFFPLPHPSPRLDGWLERNPWFEAEVVAKLRARVGELVG